MPAIWRRCRHSNRVLAVRRIKGSIKESGCLNESIAVGAASGALTGVTAGGGAIKVIGGAVVGAAGAAANGYNNPCEGGASDILVEAAFGALSGVIGRRFGITSGVQAARSGVGGAGHGATSAVAAGKSANALTSSAVSAGANLAATP